MALLEEIAARLSTQAVGSTASTAAWRIVFRDFLPGTIGGSTKAQQIVITQTGGYPQLLAEQLQYPTFQVRVRAASTSSTGLEGKMQDVVNALDRLGTATLSSRNYLDILIEGEPVYLGRDENQRPVMAANFVAWRSRTT